MFVTFAQYLSYQFFKTGFPLEFSYENEKLDVSHLYDLYGGRALRSRVKGKLKARIISGEEYPPYLDDVPEVPMYYPAVNEIC